MSSNITQYPFAHVECLNVECGPHIAIAVRSLSTLHCHCIIITKRIILTHADRPEINYPMVYLVFLLSI